MNFRSDLRVGDMALGRGHSPQHASPAHSFPCLQRDVTDRGKPDGWGQSEAVTPYKEQAQTAPSAAVEGKLGSRRRGARPRAKNEWLQKEKDWKERDWKERDKIWLEFYVQHARIRQPARSTRGSSTARSRTLPGDETSKDDLDTRRRSQPLPRKRPGRWASNSEPDRTGRDTPSGVGDGAQAQICPGTRWHSKLRATGDTDILTAQGKSSRQPAMRLPRKQEKSSLRMKSCWRPTGATPPIAGRELVQELIRARARPAPVNPPEALGDNPRST